MDRRYIVFLRGINIGGNNIIPMAKLRVALEDAGFGDVQTYIASGNVLLTSPLSEEVVATAVQKVITEHFTHTIAVVVRTPQELAHIVQKNPFTEGDQTYVHILLFAEPVSKDFITSVSTPGREEVRLGTREVYIHYPDGAGRSKLKLPKSAALGTARNMNTITKLLALAKQ